MKLTLRLVSVPPNRMPLSYFKHNDLSIEAPSTHCDDLFKIVLLEIPELKKIIIDNIEENCTGTKNDAIEEINILIDFAEHVDLLLYLKLTYSNVFNILFTSNMSD